MRTVLIILFIAIVVTVSFGFYVKPEDYRMGEFCIGIGISGLFFLWMPLFIYHRWRKRNFKDYMLTKENLDKMREESEDKKM
ncbi:MAG: hypothetical protein R3359_02010 [Marinirhabdus sp.]|nr:hypothetical protein [Marinirhabdus sp.]